MGKHDHTSSNPSSALQHVTLGKFLNLSGPACARGLGAQLPQGLGGR